MTTFADTLDTLNTGTLALLGNCTVAWTGGSCTGLFQTGYADTLGISNADNSVLVRSADISGLALATAITIDGTGYTQRERQPDGNGMTRIVVEKA